MLGRIVALAMLWLAAVGAAPPPQPRIVAVGDLHGDFDAWTQVALAAGLIDAAGHWAGGNTTLVQLGDITDRGPDSLKIIRNLQQLQSEAPRTGGSVVVVLGNHEAMNLLGDNRYTTAGEYAAFADDRSPARRERLYAQIRQKLEAEAHAINPKALPSEVRAQWLAKTPLGLIEHQLAWGPRGELGQWATRNPAVIKIGDTIFAHGGISEEYAKLTIDAINSRAARAMAGADDTPQSILNDPLGPLWYRGLVMRDSDAESRRGTAGLHPTQQQELDAVLAAYGAKRMVIAHTPSLNGIAVTNDGHLFRIDTGMSRYYGGPLSWLEIIGDKVTPHGMKRATP